MRIFLVSTSLTVVWGHCKFEKGNMKYKIKQLIALIGTAILGNHSIVDANSLIENAENTPPQSHHSNGSDSFLGKLGSPTESRTTTNRTTRDGDNKPGKLSFSQENYIVEESSSKIEFQVDRIGCESGTPEVSVSYATSNGTAEAGSDYAGVNDTLTWKASACDSQNFAVTINDDDLLEGNETVNVKLSDPTGGAQLGQKSEVALTIIDNDSVIGFSENNYVVNEGDQTELTENGTAEIVINRDCIDGVASPASVQYTAGSSGHEVTWKKDECAPKILTVPYHIFPEPNDDQKFNLGLSNPSGAKLGQNQAVLTIVDDDNSVIGFSQDKYYFNEGDQSATINIERTCRDKLQFTPAASAQLTSDSSGRMGEVTWQKGECVSKSLDIPVVSPYNLWVIDPVGAKIDRSFITSLVVNKPPIPDFTISPDIPNRAPSTVTLDAKSSTDDGTIVEYNWSTSDGQTASGPKVEMTFSSAGSHIITLTVKDNGGLTAEVQKTVEVGENQPPIASFTALPTQGKAPLTVTLDATASDDLDGTIVKYDWSVNGQPTSPTDAKITLDTAGTHTVELTVTDDGGLTAKAQEIVEVDENQPPTASFTASVSKTQPPPVFTVNLDASGSKDVDGTIVSYNWKASDGDSLSGTKTTKNFDKAGDYTISLVVVDDSKAKSTKKMEKKFTVPPIYRLTVNKNSSGNITGNGIDCGIDCNKRYFKNTKINLTAIPNAKFVLAGWTGPCSGTLNNICELTMNKDQTNIGAIFEPISLSLTVKNNGGTGNGIVTSNKGNINCGSSCSDVYAQNATITLEARPSDGSIFDSWRGDCDFTEATTCEVTINQSKNVTANFTLCNYNIVEPTIVNHDAKTHEDRVDVLAPSGCEWTATSHNEDWLTIIPKSGDSSAITYSVTANTETEGREGKLTIAGQSFVVFQDGKPLQEKPPVAKFKYIPAKEPNTVILDASQSFIIGDSKIVEYRYQWKASNGETRDFVTETVTAELSFETAGKYEVELVVVNDAGLPSVNLATQTIEIEVIDNPLFPVIDIDPTSADSTPATINLDASRSIGSINYEWSYSTLLNPEPTPIPGGEKTSVTFDKGGSYTITLVVTDDAGLPAEAKEQISIGDWAVLEFQGLKDHYEIGDVIKIDLVENLKVKSRFHRVDLWVAIQVPPSLQIEGKRADNLIFRVNNFSLVSVEPQAFRKSLQETEAIHRVLEFEVTQGFGGDYIFYAAYVEEGKNPMTDGFTVLKSNLATKGTVLSDR